MTLFITFIIWIMWLIITKYALNLINIASENHKYYKSYYAAYWWIELELSKIKYHWIWFSEKNKKTEPISTNNFTWWSPDIKHNFESQIYTSWLTINANPSSLFASSNCDDESNFIRLWTWEWVMLPLFYDKSTSFSWKDYNVLLSLSPWDINIHYRWSLIVSFQEEWGGNLSANLTWISGVKSLGSIFGLLSFDGKENPYIVLWARRPSLVCVKSDSIPMISPYSYIQSRWEYMDRSVKLNLLKKNAWADFAIYWVYE